MGGCGGGYGNGGGRRRRGLHFDHARVVVLRRLQLCGFGHLSGPRLAGMGSDGLTVLMDPVAPSFVANSLAIVAQMLPLLSAFVICVCSSFFFNISFFFFGGLANICTARPYVRIFRLLC